MDKIINRVSDKIIDYLTINRYIDSDKRDVYLYSSEVFIQSAINIIVTLLIGWIFNLFFENLCFFIAFKILRKFSGGLHSSKYSSCLMISLLLNISIMFLFVYSKNWVSYWLLLFEILTIITVCVFVPITNDNKKLSQKEKKIYKIIAITESVVLFIVSLILIRKHSVFALSICYAMVLNSILIIANILTKYYNPKQTKRKS